METTTNNLETKLKKLATAPEMELRLTDITRYHDVEEGKLVLTVGHRVKTWKAIWLNTLLFNVRGNRNLPRGDFIIRYRHYEHWIDCPTIRLSRRVSMRIVPLNSSRWVDMGVDLYLCDNEGWPNPLNSEEYLQLTDALKIYGINQLTVEEATHTISQYRCGSHELLGLEGFWGNSVQE
jgi:hypothetical protein